MKFFPAEVFRIFVRCLASSRLVNFSTQCHAVVVIPVGKLSVPHRILDKSTLNGGLVGRGLQAYGGTVDA